MHVKSGMVIEKIYLQILYETYHPTVFSQQPQTWTKSVLKEKIFSKG